MISPDVLKRFPYFAGVSTECLKAVAKISTERSFRAGERIFEESKALSASGKIYDRGEEATHLMILAEGQVDITYGLPNGSEIVVGTLVSGDLMALAAVIPPYQLTGNGIAKQDGRLIQIEGPGLRALCEEHPELGYRVMHEVSKATMSRLTETRIQLAGIT